MSNGYIIVDDSDVQLSYTGTWSVAGAGTDYRHTVRATNGSSSTMSFTFSGTSVSLIGNYDSRGQCTVVVSLDGEAKSFNSSNDTVATHQQVIWASAQLSDKNHTLVYSIESCKDDASESSVWLDHILYEPSPSSSISAARYFIDDTSHQVEWNGDWIEESEDGDFNATRHVMQKDASLRLRFTGSKASVYGRVDSNSSLSTAFSLDGGDAEVFSASSGVEVQNNVEFYSSDLLEQGEHILVMTVNSDTPVAIDYFIVRSNPIDMAGDGTAGSKETSMKTIIGAAVGSVVLLIALALGYWFYRRRRSPVKLRPHTITPSPFPNHPSLYPPSPNRTTSKQTCKEGSSIHSSMYSSSRQEGIRGHARMRSGHKPSEDDLRLTGQLSAPSRPTSVGASSSASASSSSQYTDVDVYANYHDPFNVPSPTIASHSSHSPSINSTTHLVPRRRNDSIQPCEFSEVKSVPRRKSKMQSVVTVGQHHSGIAYDLPSPPGYGLPAFPSPPGLPSHFSSTVSDMSRSTTVHATNPSDTGRYYLPPLAGFNSAAQTHEHNDFFPLPVIGGSSSSHYAAPSSRRQNIESSYAERGYQSSDDEHSTPSSSYPSDVKRPDGLVVLSVAGLSTCGQSPRRTPTVHMDSGLRVEGNGRSDLPDELPPVYTPR